MSRNTKEEKRQIRHERLRKRVAGTTERPRLVVFRSTTHIYAQVVDDTTGKTLVAASDLAKKKGAEGPAFEGKKSDRAKQVGALVAKRCLEKGIKKVVFDRGGYQYHGRVSKVAEGAREAGLDF